MSRTNSYTACVQKRIQIVTTPLSKSQKRQQRRLGPLTFTERITNTTYQLQNDNDPLSIKTVHRNHLVEFYPKEVTISPMIEKYVPMDRRHDDF